MARRLIAGCAFLAVVAIQSCWGADEKEDTTCDRISRFARDRLSIPAPTASIPLHFPCKLPGAALDFQFVIATAPNPIETHLALWFDREVESIQSAADDVGFRFQSAWIPWDPDLIHDEPDLDKRKLQFQERKRVEAEPGVLLFRAKEPKANGAASGKNSDLVVLLVPETPTGGIDPEVFCDAVRMVVSVSGDPIIPVLGPSFSGSFASLKTIMGGEAWPEDKPCEGRIGKEIASKLRVTSGSASSAGAWEEAFGKQPASHYQTTVHNNNELWRMLKSRFSDWNVHDRVATLSESETRIGSGEQDADGGKRKSPPPKSPLRLRYPREISRLRNAYGDQELKSVVGAQQQTSFRNLLTFRIYDAGPATDTTPVFATKQTPLSQDSVLEAIARTLQNEQIKMAEIQATDPFDALFIARYLRDACPNVRLVTPDSDLLWVRGAQDFPLRAHWQ